MKFLGRISRAAVLGAALALAFATQSFAASSHPTSDARSASTSVITHAVKDTKFASASVAEIPAAAPSGCLSGWVCIYASAFYSHGPGLLQQTNENWGLDLGSSNSACNPGTAAPDNQGGWNDCVSSIYNNTSSNFFFYTNTDCSSGGGFQLEVDAHSGRNNLNTDIGSHGTGYFNDSLTSDRKGSAGSC